MGASQREKGKRWERAVANIFRLAFPGREVKRNIQSRYGAAGEGADVEVADLPIHIEAKCGKKPNPRAALKQAIDEAKEGDMPVAIIKDDYDEPFVTMRLKDFVALAKEMWK